MLWLVLRHELVPWDNDNARLKKWASVGNFLPLVASLYILKWSLHRHLTILVSPLYIQHTHVQIVLHKLCTHHHLPNSKNSLQQNPKNSLSSVSIQSLFYEYDILVSEFVFNIRLIPKQTLFGRGDNILSLTIKLI